MAASGTVAYSCRLESMRDAFWFVYPVDSKTPRHALFYLCFVIALALSVAGATRIASLND